MPLYEYQCRECGHVQTVLQLPGAAPCSPPGQCKACGMFAGMERLISSPGVHVFKGKGFHANDYPRKRKGASPKTQVKVGAPTKGGK